MRPRQQAHIGILCHLSHKKTTFLIFSSQDNSEKYYGLISGLFVQAHLFVCQAHDVFHPSRLRLDSCNVFSFPLIFSFNQTINIVISLAALLIRAQTLVT